MTDPNHDAEVQNHLRLKPSDDRLEVSLIVEPGIDADRFDGQSIDSLLHSKGVTPECLDADNARELLDLARTSPNEQHERVIARGKKPIHGRDGQFEWTPDFKQRFEQIDTKRSEVLSQTGDGPPADPEAARDFYNWSPFVIVRADELLGHFIEPTKGVNGIDVYAKTIVGRDGKPCQFQTNDGTFTNDKGEVFAEIQGLLEHDDDSLHVSDELHIKLGVDFSTGNIEFPGDLCVDGGVQDCFTVAAEGPTSIKGLIQAAHICTDSHLEVEGVAARDKGTIRCGGNLTARYLDAVHANCYGTCMVKKEVTNCTLSAARGFIGSDCAVRGGQLAVGGKADIGTLGSEHQITTVVLIGDVPGLTEPLTSGLALVDRFETCLRGSDPACNRLRSRLLEICSILEGFVEPSLTVRKCIHPGVAIHLPGWKITAHQTVKGPLTISLDDEGKPKASRDAGSTPVAIDDLFDICPDETVPVLQAAIKKLRPAA